MADVKMRWKRLKKRWSGKHLGRDKDPMACLYSEHSLTLDQLADHFPLARIDTANVLASRGISREEARLQLAERRRHFPLARSALGALGRQCLGPLPLLLFCSSLLCLGLFLADRGATNLLAMALFQLALAICVVAIGTGEQRAHRRMAKTAKKDNGHYFAVRQGVEVAVRGADLLVGDLLWLRGGQRVPADVRLLHTSSDFRADLSWILETGQQQAELTPLPAKTDVFRARNVLFAHSLCAGGEAFGVVIRTGGTTLYSRLLSEKPFSPEASKEPPAERESCLELEHRQLVRRIVWLSLSLSTAAFALSLALNSPAEPLSAFVHVFLVVLIAQVPQALPLALSAQLLLVMRRLRKQCARMVAKSAYSADTLGRTTLLMVHSPSVFCPNRPVVTHIWLAADGRTLSAADLVASAVRERQAKLGTESPLGDRFGERTLELLRTASCCTKTWRQRTDCLPQSASILGSFRRRQARVVDTQIPSGKPHIVRTTSHLAHVDLEDGWTVSGSSVQDVALYKFLRQIGPFESPRNCVSPVQLGASGLSDALPFDSDLSLSMAAGEPGLLARIRGAPEKVLPMCSSVRAADGREEPLTQRHLEQFEDAYAAFSAEGQSLTAFAVLMNDQLLASAEGRRPSCLSWTESTSSDSSLEEPRAVPDYGWCFLGMAVLADPLRADSASLVRLLECAGVRLCWLCEAHPLTVEALAQQAGLIGDKEQEQPWVIQMPLELRVQELEVPSRSGKCLSVHSSSSGYHSSDRCCQRPDCCAEPEGGHRPEMEDAAVVDELFAQMTGAGSRHAVFSQLDPLHTLALVQKCQLSGHCVTFVADGSLMDTPALRQADVGIVASEGSCLLALEAADVLCSRELDLSRLAHAVGEGRGLASNQAATVAFSLSHSLPTLLPVLLTLLLGLPPGLGALQILSVALLTQIPAALALAFVRRPLGPPPPRHPSFAALFYAYAIASPVLSAGCLVAYLSVFWANGVLLGLVGAADDEQRMQELSLVVGQASACWHLTLVGAQQLHLWLCAGHGRLDAASVRCLPLWASVVFALGTLALSVHSAPVAALFAASPLPPWAWAFPVGTAAALVATNSLARLGASRSKRAAKWLDW